MARRYSIRRADPLDLVDLPGEDAYPWQVDIWDGGEWQGGCDWPTFAEALEAYVTAADEKLRRGPLTDADAP